MEDPQRRPISIRMPLGGLGDALSLGPLIEFCGRGHPKSNNILQLPRKHHWIYKNYKFVTRIDPVSSHAPQPHVTYDNEWFLKEEMKELAEFGRVLSRTERLCAMAGNSLVIDRKPMKLKANNNLRKRFADQFPSPRIVVSLKASNKSRSHPDPESVLKSLKQVGGSIINLDQMTNDRFIYSVEEMIALISLADVAVAVDSGPLHIANGFGKSIVALAGYTGVDGFLNYNNQKMLMVRGTCPKETGPCLWNISCKEGRFVDKEKTFTPCMGIDGEVVMGAVERQIHKPKKILAVMPTWNSFLHTRMAVDSIDGFDNIDTFLVDNGSTDGTITFFESNGLQIDKNTDISVAKAQNIGLRKAVEENYDFVMLMNNDVVLSRGYIDKLVELFDMYPEAGLIVGTPVEKGDCTWISEARVGGHLHYMNKLPRGAFSATLISVAAIKRVGIFDETFAPRYIEDEDYSVRLRLAGYAPYMTESAVFFHDVGTTVDKVVGREKARLEMYWEKNKNYFKEKWGQDVHRSDRSSIVFKEPFNGNGALTSKYKIEQWHGAFK